MADLKPVGNILRNAHVREEGVVLEDGVDVAIEWWKIGDIFAVKEDATRGWSLKASDHAQRGRLSGTGWAEQREELAVPHLKVNPSNRGSVTRSAELLRDPLQPNGWHAVTCGSHGGEPIRRGR